MLTRDGFNAAGRHRAKNASKGDPMKSGSGTLRFENGAEHDVQYQFDPDAGEGHIKGLPMRFMMEGGVQLVDADREVWALDVGGEPPMSGDLAETWCPVLFRK
jgi:hypothetical protein